MSDFKQIKKLREKTAAGMMDCKQALEEAEGDFDKAVEIIRKKGQDIAAKKSDREASEGVIAAYIHPNKKLGAMVEINCETDFVARNQEFLDLAQEIAMQVAASDPQYVSSDDVPEEVLVEKTAEFKEQINQDKPVEVQEKIIVGKLKKFQEEISLLPRELVKDPEKTVAKLLEEKIAKLGENISIKNFIRYQI